MSNNIGFEEAKKSLDFIFCALLLSAQRIDRIQHKNMELVGIWSYLLMGISWLQRIYGKFGLKDQDCAEHDDSNLKHTLEEDLGIISQLLDQCLEELEELNSGALLQGAPYENIHRFLQVMLDRIYICIYESQTLIDMIAHEQKAGGENGVSQG